MDIMEMDERGQEVTAKMYKLAMETRDILPELLIENDNLRVKLGNSLQQGEADLEQGLILGTDSKDDIEKKILTLSEKCDRIIARYEEQVLDNKVGALLDKINGLNQESLGAKLSQAVKQAWEKFTAFGQDLKTNMTNMVDKVKDTVKTCISNVKGLALNYLDTAKENAQTHANANLGTRVDAAVAFGVKQPVGEVIQKMRDAVDNAKSGMREAVDKVKGFVLDAKDAVIGKVLEVSHDIAQQRADKAMEKAEAAIEKAEALQGKADDIQDKIDEIERD